MTTVILAEVESNCKLLGVTLQVVAAGRLEQSNVTGGKELAVILEVPDNCSARLKVVD